MLKKVTVKNFAVIDALTLEPGAGLNALTGETGAGKSIVIEALGFALGARASVDWLRAGAPKLEVEAVFGGKRDVVVRRELDSDGRTRAWIDGKTVSVAALSALGETLVDFHGQHEHQTLLRPAAQLELLDAYGADDGDKRARISTLRPAVQDAYRRWQELGRQLEALDLPEEERAKRLDLCKFQVEEILSAGLKPGEEESLEAQLPRLKNAERLSGLAAEAYALLYEAEGSAIERLQKAEKALSDMARLDPAAEELSGLLAQARQLADDAARRVSEYRDRSEADPAELDRLLGRLDKIARLKKKYGPDTAKILEALERLKSELTWLEDAGGRAAQVQKERETIERELDKLCGALHKARMAAGLRLASAVTAELKGLGMPSARVAVSVELEDGSFGPTGADRIEFQIAANAGEGLKSLKAVASGGELSRVMLALKTVLARADRVPVLVFDEVDAGVGGSVARAVGERLAGLGRARQVLCVTHLPQVAGFAERHFHVSKATVAGRTNARVETLEGDKRLKALAVMMGGRDASAASLKHARELLEECQA
ncbi:MAG: DNA repair protein RecN [Elusimicrobia bacterium]|nr:DNA repair protein RecN [Elusimicrobiota bacterium]